MNGGAAPPSLYDFESMSGRWEAVAAEDIASRMITAYAGSGNIGPLSETPNQAIIPKGTSTAATPEDSIGGSSFGTLNLSMAHEWHASPGS